MKQIFIPFTNWRVHVLAVLAMAAFVLLTSEPKDDAPLLTFLAVKAAGFASAFAAYRLGRWWHGRGRIPELASLADGDD